MACWTNQAQQIFCFLSKSLLFDRKYLMSFIIERHFWPPFCFFGDIIDNKKTSVSLHGWDRPRGNQSCPLGPILGHEKWKFQGDVDHHLCCAFSLCLISLLYSQRVFSRYQIYISSYIFEIIRIMYEGNREIQLHILFIHYFLQLGNHSLVTCSDEFELEFSSSSRDMKVPSRAKPSWGISIFELKPS